MKFSKPILSLQLKNSTKVDKYKLVDFDQTYNTYTLKIHTATLSTKENSNALISGLSNSGWSKLEV